MATSVVVWWWLDAEAWRYGTGRTAGDGIGRSCRLTVEVQVLQDVMIAWELVPGALLQFAILHAGAPRLEVAGGAQLPNPFDRTSGTCSSGS